MSSKDRIQAYLTAAAAKAKAPAKKPPAKRSGSTLQAKLSVLANKYGVRINIVENTRKMNRIVVSGLKNKNYGEVIELFNKIPATSPVPQKTNGSSASFYMVGTRGAKVAASDLPDGAQTYTLQVNDSDGAIMQILEKLKKCGDDGHSVSFQIDEDSFGMDGDGADKIYDISTGPAEMSANDADWSMDTDEDEDDGSSMEGTTELVEPMPTEPSGWGYQAVTSEEDGIVYWYITWNGELNASGIKLKSEEGAQRAVEQLQAKADAHEPTEEHTNEMTASVVDYGKTYPKIDIYWKGEYFASSNRFSSLKLARARTAKIYGLPLEEVSATFSKAKTKKKKVIASDNGDRGREILRQLGGNKFVAMTGAKNLSTDTSGLSFKIGRNDKGITHVKVKLNASDTYTMQFLKIRGTSTWKVEKEVSNVHAADLCNVFTANTGLETSLGTMGK